jgi:hypothetical protein
MYIHILNLTTNLSSMFIFSMWYVFILALDYIDVCKSKSRSEILNIQRPSQGL